MMTEEQTHKLRETLRGHRLEAIITLALDTGMRRDELLHLQWQDIDLEKREVRVLDSKTKSSERIIHVSEAVTEVLTQHRLLQREFQRKVGEAWQNFDLVFPDQVGAVLSPHAFIKQWYELLDYATLPRMRFHDVRVAVRRAQGPR